LPLGGLLKRGHDATGETEPRNIAARGHFNDHRVLAPCVIVELSKLPAEPLRFYPHDRVDSRVVVFTAVEHVPAERVFLQGIGLSRHRVLHTPAQKPAKPLGSHESRAG
jgi:hypothetical protein